MPSFYVLLKVNVYLCGIIFAYRLLIKKIFEYEL